MRRQRCPSRRVLHGDPPGGQLVPQAIRGGPVTGGARGRAEVEQLGEIGLERGLSGIWQHAENPVEIAQRVKGAPGVGRGDGPGRDPPVHVADELEDGREGGRYPEVVVHRGRECLPGRPDHGRETRVVGHIVRHTSARAATNASRRATAAAAAPVDSSLKLRPVR